MLSLGLIAYNFTLIAYIYSLAAILLTTPGDSYRKSRKGRVKNPDMKIARVTIINYCQQHNLAYWDWYEIMGGYGSMANWFLMKLAQKDRVHYNGRGYQIQGELLYRALMKGYNHYVQEKKDSVGTSR